MRISKAPRGIGLATALTIGLLLAITSAALATTPGWECVPTTAGQAVVSGGTGATPSCSSGTPVSHRRTSRAAWGASRPCSSPGSTCR